MTALLDTNVLIRFLTSDKTKKFRGVYSFFESLEHGDLRIELTLIVLFQVVFVLKSFYSVPRKDITAGMMGILEYKGIIVRNVDEITSPTIHHSFRPPLSGLRSQKY